MLTIAEQSGPAFVLADVTACPTCGYLIAGLPPTGRCPECGGGYDRRELVIFGRRSRWSWWPVALSAASSSFLAATSLRDRRNGSDVVYVAFGGLGLVGFVRVMVARSWENRPGSARLRLSASGCRLDIEPDPPPVVRQVTAAVAAAIGRRLTGTHELAWVPEPLVPWPKVRHVRLSSAGQGRWRVRVERPGTEPGRRVAADVIADLTPEHLAAVRAFARRFTAVAGPD